MKLFQFKTTQARIALLIGALTLAAAINAVTSIIQAASFQQKLAGLQRYTQAIEQHTQARVDLLKLQLAIKNTLITEDRAKDYGDWYRYQSQLADYVYLQQLEAGDDPTTQDLLLQNDTLTQQGDEFYAKLDPESSNEEAISINLEQIDPTAANIEAQVQSLADQNLLNLRSEIAAIEKSTQTSTLVGQAGLLVLAVLIIWAAYALMKISRPLDSLTSAVVAFENNTFKPELLAEHTQRPDELGQLSRAVGGMAQSITEANRLKEIFLQAAQRFIPSQYLDFLGKENITKVNLGDHVSAEMAVMFSDIRGFTTMSEKMTAKENFDFVNEYLKLVSPIIQKHEGFIVKFLGDGMMAIFPYGVGDAVQAGIEKEILVQQFNETLKKRNLPPITVGIGIHTGNMMVGMIGEELRMQGDAFSDNVNLTSRIEGLNKFYGTSMIISEDTLRQLPQPITIKMRYLGKAVVKGRVEPLGMYEVYEGLSVEVIRVKEATRALFEKGIQFYTEGRFTEAAKAFNQVLEQDAGDKTARYYLESCAEWLDRPLPTGWNGAIVMDAK
jgi:class 3 adenylate cyclase